MSGYFVTGTDTGVGKTIASAVLTYVLKACYWKPIQSGLADDPSDLEIVKSITEFPAEHFFDSQYSFQASLSPDQAAEKEGGYIDLKQINLPQSDKPLVVEGAGGIYVPINEQHTMMDVMKKLNLPIIIVTRGTLGTINHTLMTIEALRQNELSIHGVIFNGELNFANQKAIEKWGQVKTLFHIPSFKEITNKTVQRWVYEYTFSA